jgi:hypothetical protein
MEIKTEGKRRVTNTERTRKNRKTQRRKKDVLKKQNSIKKGENEDGMTSDMNTGVMAKMKMT